MRGHGPELYPKDWRPGALRLGSSSPSHPFFTQFQGHNDKDERTLARKGDGVGAKKPHEQQPGQTKMCCFPSLWHLFANRSVFLGHCACVFQTNRGCLCPSPSLSQAPSLASTGLDACLCPLISALAPHPCRLSSLSTQRGREGRMGVWRLCTEALCTVVCGDTQQYVRQGVCACHNLRNLHLKSGAYQHWEVEDRPSHSEPLGTSVLFGPGSYENGSR